MNKLGMLLYCIFIACCIYFYTIVLKPAFNIEGVELLPSDEQYEKVETRENSQKI